jgi:glycosyltransferase involved in cell wall biosynthesis
LTDRWSYQGSLERKEKLDFFHQIDLLSVPTTYREPKGLFVLEAAAAGIPYIQPDHGAFPELHQRLQAGWLFPAGNQPAYVAQLQAAIDQVRDNRQAVGDDKGDSRERIRHEVSIQQMATRILEVVARSQ